MEENEIIQDVESSEIANEEEVLEETSEENVEVEVDDTDEDVEHPQEVDEVKDENVEEIPLLSKDELAHTYKTANTIFIVDCVVSGLALFFFLIPLILPVGKSVSSFVPLIFAISGIVLTIVLKNFLKKLKNQKDELEKKVGNNVLTFGYFATAFLVIDIVVGGVILAIPLTSLAISLVVAAVAAIGSLVTALVSVIIGVILVLALLVIAMIAVIVGAVLAIIFFVVPAIMSSVNAAILVL